VCLAASVLAAGLTALADDAMAVRAAAVLQPDTAWLVSWSAQAGSEPESPRVCLSPFHNLPCSAFFIGTKFLFQAFYISFFEINPSDKSKNLRLRAAQELYESRNGGSALSKAKRAAAYNSLASNEGWLYGDKAERKMPRAFSDQNPTKKNMGEF
jgi:hypothetical protein